MTTNKGRGRSRKASPLRRLTDAAKRSTASLVCVSLIATTVLGSFVFAAEDETKDAEDPAEIYAMTLDSLCDAIEDSVRNGEPLEEGEYVFAGSAAGAYEKLFDTEDELLYEVEPDVDEGGSLTLKTFVRLSESDVEGYAELIEAEEAEEEEVSEDTEDEAEPEEETVDDDDEEEPENGDKEIDLSRYSVTGNEEVIFLLINNTDDEVTARIRVEATSIDDYDDEEADDDDEDEEDDDDGIVIYETPQIAVPGNSEAGIVSESSLTDSVEYFTVDEKTENMNAAALSIETGSSAEKSSGDTWKNGSTATIVVRSSESSSNAVNVVETAANALRLTYVDDGCEPMDGTMYDPVTVNGSKAVAFVTTLSKLGVDYGIRLLSNEDPEFIVQFWANLDTIYRESVTGDTDLTVIETHTDTGAVLPSNGTDQRPATSVIELKEDGNGGFVIDSENVLTQMYADESYDFDTEPTVHNMNKLEINGDYELVEIWKLKNPTATDPNSTNKDDWEVYPITRVGDTTKYTMEFTNSAEAAAGDETLILVEDNDVFRFVYDTTTADAYLDANFYDYNVGDGKVYAGNSTSSGEWTSGTKYINVGRQGINSESNYSGSGTPLGFGNNNVRTGLGELYWDLNQLNKYNNNGLLGCTFGLPNSLDTTSNVITFSSGVDAPALFGGTAVGKEAFPNVQLDFIREGDTYTLSAVSGSNGVGVSDLDRFENPGSYISIFTNSFWPMDEVNYDGMDPLFGGESSVNYFGLSNDGLGTFAEGTMPASDDGTAHNSYFGMNFEIEFSYMNDYVGPLEYFFFGDDDMWVFLDDQLVIDIGGVHSSVGEHVDLWDYLADERDSLKEGETAIHTLSVFYTERGASGSTCYIQYTLPEVSSVTPVDDASNLIIEKEVDGAETDQEFEFTITLKDGSGEDASELTNQYSCIITNAAGLFVESKTIKNGDPFTLQDGWSIEIRNLPNGTVATVTETNGGGYTTTYEVGSISGDEKSATGIGSGKTASGTVSDSGTTYIKFINTAAVSKDVDVPEAGETEDEKFDDNGIQANVGDTLEYKISYTNTCETEATVTITDVLDDGLDYVEGSASDGGTYDETTRTITWELKVSADGEGSVTFKAIVNENALETNEITNTAKVKVGDDPEVETNPVYTPVPHKDVDVVVEGESENEKFGDSGDEVKVGDTLTYKIDYQNSYDDPATVTITDVLDIGLDFVEASDGGIYDESTRTITWVLEDVAPHSEEGYYVTFTAIVNKEALAENEITNKATVMVNEDSIVTNEVDNPVPDKDVDADGNGEYGDNGMPVNVGDTLTYIIHYDNGYDTAATVTITDVLDEGLDYVAGSASNDGVYDESTRTISWTIENVEAHDHGSVTFKATVNETALKRNEVKNTASVQIDNHDAVDTNTVYNPVTHKDVDVDTTDEKEYGDSGIQVHVGDTLTYKIDYENPDDNPATVTITDVLDKGLDYVSSDPEGSYNKDTRTITWTIGNVEAHKNSSVTFTAKVNEAALEKNYVDNTASVQVGDHPEIDTNTVYNPVPEKDVDIDEDEEYGDDGLGIRVGDTLTYTIDYFNGYNDAADVTITDVLDDGLTYKSSDPEAVVSTNNDGATVLTWTIKGVKALTSGSVSFTAEVNDNALEMKVVDNDAEVRINVGEEHKTTITTNEVNNPTPSLTKEEQEDDWKRKEDSGQEMHDGEDTSDDGYGSWDDADNNQDVVYHVKISGIADAVESLTLHDYLQEGLDFEPDTVSVTLVYADGTQEEQLIEGTDYKKVQITEDQPCSDPDQTDCTFEVEIQKSVLENINSNDDYLLIEYKAKTDTQADDYFDEEEEREYMDVLMNEAYMITYFSSPAGVPIAYRSTPIDTETDIFGFAIYKYTYIDGKETPLANAEFTLQRADDEGGYEYAEFSVETGSDDLIYYMVEGWVDDPEETDEDWTTTLVSGEDGYIRIEGLDDDTYILTETKAPDGYDRLDGHIEVTINEDGTIAPVRSVGSIGSTRDGAHTVGVSNGYIPIKDVDVDPEDGLDYGDNERGVNVGDILTYKIEYINGEDEPAEVVITDTLDEGLTFVSASDNGIYDKSTHTITWTFEDVPSHVWSSVTFTAQVNENALERNEIDNTAYVSIDDDWSITNTRYNPVTHKDVDINPEDDHEYGDSGRSVSVGDTLTYKIDYENPRDEAATVKITDELDKGLTFVSASDNGSYDADTRTITWTIENVEAHKNDSVTFVAAVNDDAFEKNEVDNTATVEVGDYPTVTNTVYNPVSHKDVDIDPDDGLEYGDNGVGTKVGDQITYRIEYENAEDEAATVKITDVLDDGLTYVSSDPAAVISTDGGGHTVITWTIEDVASGTTGSVEFTVEVNETALVRNEVDNTATIEIGEHSSVTNTVYNPVTDKDVDVDTADDKEYGDNGAVTKVGDTLGYKIDYENPYNEASVVTVADELDIGLTYVEGSASDGGTYNESTRTITWTIENVEAHKNGSVTFEATVNDEALVRNEVSNNASVEVGEHSSVTNTVYNPVTNKDVDVDTADSKDYGDNGAGTKVGDQIKYKIDYENPYDEASDVIVTDELDKGLTYVEGSASNGGAYDESTRTITWTIENVEAHKNGSVTFEATVNDNALAENEISNNANVKVGDYSTVTNTVYNPVTNKDVDINPEDDHEYGDDGHGVSIGDTLTYRIDYENPYDETADVTITDELDEGLDYVEGSASNGGTYDESTRTITWTIENVEAHKNGSVTFTATVNKDAQKEPEITNQADVKVGDHPEMKTNEVSNGTSIVDLTISKTVSGNAGSTGQEFTFEIKFDESVNGEFEYEKSDGEKGTVTVVNGEITSIKPEGGDAYSTFELKHGESVTIKGIPSGVSYSVTEGNNGGYSVTVNGTSGSSVYEGTTPSGEFEVAFTNDRTRTTSGGSGGSTRTSSGPGNNSGTSSSEGGSSSSGNTGSSINTDDIRSLPNTGESNTMMILFGVCAVLVVLLAVLFYMRRRTSD